MFCPICKLEYRPGFTRCNDCDVPLVASLDDARLHTNAPHSAEQDPDSLDLLWTGTESGISAAIAEALDAANVSYHERTRDVGPLPGLAQPVYAIIIHARDRNAAQIVLENVRRELEAPRSDSRAQAAESKISSSSPASATSMGEHGKTEDEDDSYAPEYDYVPENFDPDEATSRVWSGADTEMKNILISCLRENGIGCAVDEEEAENRICVMPQSEARAREIIREVVEASAPPE